MPKRIATPARAPNFARASSSRWRSLPSSSLPIAKRGLASFYGADAYKLTEKAKKGEFRHAEEAGYWETEMSHRAIYTVITWFNLLCPKASAKWNIRQEP